MHEVAKNSVYDERSLKPLFRGYIKHNALEHRPVIRAVVQDLRHELCIQ